VVAWRIIQRTSGEAVAGQRYSARRSRPVSPVAATATMAARSGSGAGEIGGLGLASFG
jgi:hypothetical protein